MGGGLQTNAGPGAGAYGLIVTSGFTGIAKSNPAYPLDVTGDVNISGSYRVNGVALSLGGTAAGGTGAVQFANGTAFAADVTKFFWNNTNKRLGINTGNPQYPLDVGTTDTTDGTIRAFAFIYNSDRRLKENIQPLASALSNIRKLQGVSFDWKAGGTHSVGLIAQDVQLVYPQLVSKDSGSGMLSVAYGNLVAPIIEAIKELASRSDSQAADLSALQEKVAAQEKEIESLKAAVAQLKK